MSTKTYFQSWVSVSGKRGDLNGSTQHFGRARLASMRVSHETVYRSLFIQARGALKKELLDHLRSKRRMRRSRHATVSGQSRGQIVDAISIRERPAEVEDRAIPGHWEGDLLSGAKNSYIATLVERHSRFAMLIKVPSKDTEAVVAALSQHVRKLPATLATLADVGSRAGGPPPVNFKPVLRRPSEPARVIGI